MPRTIILDEAIWHSQTGEYHSYNYGVDVRVPNWRTMRKSPIVNRNESFEFSKAIIGVLRHHNVSGPILMRINELGYTYLTDLLTIADE